LDSLVLVLIKERFVERVITSFGGQQAPLVWGQLGHRRWVVAAAAGHRLVAGRRQVAVAVEHRRVAARMAVGSGWELGSSRRSLFEQAHRMNSKCNTADKQRD
jgi:hypothetical protein